MLFGLYRGVWRYAGARDAVGILTAVLLSEIVAFVFIDLTVDLRGFPRGTFIIDWLLCSLLIGASRFWERGLAHAIRAFVGRGDQERALIIGAGRAGRSMLRELREGNLGHVVGFVDDDPAFRRRRIQGVPIVASIDEIGWALGRFAPDAVYVTIPNAARDRLEQVVEACRRADVSCRFVRRQIDLDPSLALGASVE
jgi:FlaA1/EpsC-like NDP-sugar epimerase